MPIVTTKDVQSGPISIPPQSLADLPTAAAYCGLKPDVLSGYAASGHAPHYFIAGDGPFFRKGEIREWVGANLVTARGGMPLPRRVEVLSAVTALSGPGGGPPLPISTLPNLCHLQLNGSCSGIYFLCRGDQVVYVGQSVQVVARVCSHISEGVKDFETDRVFFVPCPLNQLNDVEREFIALLKPEHNGNAGGNSRYRGR